MVEKSKTKHSSEKKIPETGSVSADVPQEIPLELPTPVMHPLLPASLRIVGITLIVGSIGLAAFFFNQYRQTKNLLNNPTLATQAQIKSLTDSVSRIMELPNETPQVATIVDKTKLGSQVFFKNTKNGDKLLIYAKTGKAILYRPSTSKIIEVAPLNISSPAPQQQGNVAGASTKATPAVLTPMANRVSVVVYNGTTDDSLADSVRAQIAKFPAYSVSVEKSVLKSYKKTTVFNLRDRSTEAQFLAKQLNAVTETELPEGETAPNADILVVAAK